MIGIVLPSIELSMTLHFDRLLKPEPGLTTVPSADEETGSWLCIGDHEDIATKDPLIFRMSPLRVGDRSGDEQEIRLPGTTLAYTPLNRRQSPARREFP